jgi:hypothetical protein
MLGSRDLSLWESALSGYEPALSAYATARKRPHLAADAAALAELPALILARAPPHITHAELSRIMRFKLARGKPRPNLQAWVDAASPPSVVAASTQALALARAGKLAAALEALSAPLKGVGPATASLVLSLADPSIPFMSDEALNAAVHSRKYTVSEGVALTAALRREARDLSEAAGNSRRWTAAVVERALWSAAHGGVDIARVAGGASGVAVASGRAAADVLRGAGGACGETEAPGRAAAAVLSSRGPPKKKRRV